MEAGKTGTSEINDLRQELNDTKNKLRIITQKFTNTKKERDQFSKDNKDLQDEIIQLQSQIRQMVPGFASNTSSQFPMFTELQNQLSEFLKCDCQDAFFDLLSPELNIDGIVYFFRNTIPTLIKHIESYFQPAETTLKEIACQKSIEGPIMNVLRKSYQSNYKEIFNQCFPDQYLQQLMQQIQSTLKLGDEAANVNKAIVSFLKKMAKISLNMAISDPIIVFDCRRIGEKIIFNGIKHESVDGFVKAKQECIVLLPSVFKQNIEGEMLLKESVLPLDYEFPE